MIKAIEFIGVVCGILGALLVARGFLASGFCTYAISSLALGYSAYKQKNWNLLLLQSVYMCANLLGVSNYVFGF